MKNILVSGLILWLLMASYFIMDSIPKWTNGVQKVGEIGDKFEIFDVKAGNRGCLMVKVKIQDQNGKHVNDQLIWACPNVRR